MIRAWSPDADRPARRLPSLPRMGWTAARSLVRLREGQSPRVMVIACSDSRVDPAQIFDARPGRDLRGAQRRQLWCRRSRPRPGHHGVSAALEFAVQVLKVREIVVMGHGACGGCQAALTQRAARRRTGPGRLHRRLDRDARRRARADRRGARHRGREAERAMEQAAVEVSLENLRTFPVRARRKSAASLTDCAAPSSPFPTGCCTCSTRRPARFQPACEDLCDRPSRPRNIAAADRRRTTPRPRRASTRSDRAWPSWARRSLRSRLRQLGRPRSRNWSSDHSIATASSRSQQFDARPKARTLTSAMNGCPMRALSALHAAGADFALIELDSDFSLRSTLAVRQDGLDRYSVSVAAKAPEVVQDREAPATLSSTS